jgi:hypothetical protein
MGSKKNCAQRGGRWMLYKKGEKSIKGQRKEKKVITIMKERQRESRYMILVITFFYLSLQACRLFVHADPL